MPQPQGNKQQPERAQLTQESLTQHEGLWGSKDDSTDETNSHRGSTDDSNTTNSQWGSTDGSTSTRSLMSNFAIQALENGILRPIRSKPPVNHQETAQWLARPREAPPESAYKHYNNKIARAPNEATTLITLMEAVRRILKTFNNDDDDDSYLTVFNQAFTAFPNDVGFNNNMTEPPKPDFIEGLCIEAYHPWPPNMLMSISGAAPFLKDHSSVILPHIAGEWKGPGGNMEEAMLQSAYDGAALVYARNQALSLIGKPDPHGHAAVMTFTTDGITLNIFAHYAMPSANNGADGTPTLEYHQYLMDSVNLRLSYQSFKHGRNMLRNLQDFASQQSRGLRDQLVEYYRRQQQQQPQQQQPQHSAQSGRGGLGRGGRGRGRGPGRRPAGGISRPVATPRRSGRLVGRGG